MTSLLITGGRVVDPVASLDAVARRANPKRHRRRDRRASRIRSAARACSTPPVRSSRRVLSTCTCTCANPAFQKRRRWPPARRPPFTAGLAAWPACRTPTPPSIPLRRCNGFASTPNVLGVAESTRSARSRWGGWAASRATSRRWRRPAPSAFPTTAIPWRTHVCCATPPYVRVTFGAFSSRTARPEDHIVARDLAIAAETGKRWHIAHLSTRGALELVRGARANGAQVTCEATPHHLTFTAVDASEIGPAARVNPPLRWEETLPRCAKACATERSMRSRPTTPRIRRRRRAMPASSAPGFTGLEIAVGAYADALPDLPLTRLVELLSTNPARILGIAGGTLRPGAAADVTIFAQRSWVVDPATFASKGKMDALCGTPPAVQGARDHRRRRAALSRTRAESRDGANDSGCIISG